MVVVGNYRNRAELRKQPRRHFRYTAKIFVNKATPLVGCSISDISHTGARLTLEHEQELPEAFTLLLTPNGDARRRCRVVWCDGLIVGVQFPEGD